MGGFSLTDQRIVKALFKAGEARYGDLKWWPADGPFEVAVGAVLTQNTAWRNVEKAIFNLKAEGCMSPEKLAKMHPATLKRLIKPAGFYKAKAGTIRRVSRVFASCRIEEMKKKPLSQLRKELLSIKGIGEETADSILLYALGKSVFVVDTYTRRVFERHGIEVGCMSYGQVQSLVHSSLKAGASEYGRFHSHIVEVAKSSCDKKGQVCSGCAYETIKKRKRV